MILKVDHVIMAVRNADQAAADFGKILGLSLEDGRIRELPQARIGMLPVPKGARIEFVERRESDGNRHSEFLQKHGEGVMGISIFVDNFEAEIERLKKNKVNFVVEEQKIYTRGILSGWPGCRRKKRTASGWKSWMQRLCRLIS